MPSPAVSSAERMRKSRQNGKIIQVRLTPENEIIIERLQAETGKTRTDIVNWLIRKSESVN